MKRQGEEGLRLSGLGYTIVRPGPLLEEPGGYKALVFDQVQSFHPFICSDRGMASGAIPRGSVSAAASQWK